jgi:hypothetical protein
MLVREAGTSPKRFAIYESYVGDEGIEIGSNAINRFSENSFEVPHELLRPEREIRTYETKIMGWGSNPLAGVDPLRVKAGECPK